MARRKRKTAGGTPSGGAAKSSPRRRGLRRRLGRLLLIVLLVPLLWVGLYRVVNPPTGVYMVQEWWRLGGVERDWRSMERISPHLARAAVAAEDARFCSHWGIDPAAVEAALEDNAEGRRLRGGSTITQQTAKNVFLWHGRSWLRKGLEAGFALAMEALWPKRRILEVYLNMAEFGEGVFGAEAAARHYYGVAASQLGPGQAARLATLLPNPKARDPHRLSGSLARRAGQIETGASTIAARGDDACFVS